MSTPTPTPNLTFLFIPGHWHTKTHAQPLLHALQTLNHTITTLQLPSVGLKTPRPTFQTDVDAIQTAITTTLSTSTSTSLCLILHSYAGMPGAEALYKLQTSGFLNPETKATKSKLTKVIFISAYVFPAGTIMDAASFIGPSNPGLSIDYTTNTSHMSDPAHFFFNDLEPYPDAAKPWVDALADTYYLGQGPVISGEEWRKAASVTALLCRRDNAVAPEMQAMVWKGVESEWIDAGHSPFVSRPEEVAGIVVRLARAAGAEAGEGR